MRFSGCPLACPWCDEPKHRDPALAEQVTVEELSQRIQALAPLCRNLLLTGGEPLAVANLQTFIDHFKQAGYWIAMESSGVGGPVPEGLDWLTLSPKTALDEELLMRANELKFIGGTDMSDAQWSRIEALGAQHPLVWLQPRAIGDKPDPAAARACIQRIQSSSGNVRLSIQSHKYLGIQ
ncbi:putative radical SAM protein [Magnetofaba australis IT-1]|uniref:7-carboxy-7-deazaguanine synthase n=1 Tax=Magnetofaba australis IT-1 TaxID=1434232 RepID=A0A1Y2K2T9_9PROT|nr:putative radical SAM protein [Magnetofaba australis IT-1]